jgi:hypothetical protein
MRSLHFSCVCDLRPWLLWATEGRGIPEGPWAATGGSSTRGADLKTPRPSSSSHTDPDPGFGFRFGPGGSSKNASLESTPEQLYRLRHCLD